MKKETKESTAPLWLFEVRLLTQSIVDASISNTSAEYYAASDIEDVWNAIELDRLDERIEVEGIKRLVPILRVINN